MTAIVSRIRDLIADGPADPVWSDDDIERFADAVAIVGARVRLEPVGQLPSAVWRAPLAPWEQGAQLYDDMGHALVVTDDRGMSGVWQLAAPTHGPVWAVGNVVDIHLVAADLLEAWAAREKASYDVEIAGDTRLTRSQKVTHLLELAERYRRQCWPLVTVSRRTDLAGG